MSPEKKSNVAETGNQKRHFLKGTRITLPCRVGLPQFEKKSFHNVPFFLTSQ